ncbi:MAG: ABC transporter ATP-binding protein [Ilumatobacter fluminis]|uniref:ABC transporter ATP-binding protein n=1 Tax=Ilumatobacter fluminis TaxID=467091 RepID=UPI0032F026F8
MTNVLTARDLRKSYGRRDDVVPVLRGASANFRPGEFTALMGPSGSGKSTFMRCASGLERPDSGSVVVGGDEIADLNEPALTKLRRRKIGFVFQSYNLMPTLTVRQNLELPARLADHKVDKRAMRDLADRFGIGETLRRRPAQLSGGQRQRVAIARAILAGSQVLFADEPTGALDRASGRVVLDVLRESVSAGQSIIMATHDPAAAALADRVLFVSDGTIGGELVGADAETIAARSADMEMA